MSCPGGMGTTDASAITRSSPLVPNARDDRSRVLLAFSATGGRKMVSESIGAASGATAAPAAAAPTAAAPEKQEEEGGPAAGIRL